MTATHHLVRIYHDESCFHSNEDHAWQWAEEGRLTIKPKGKGRGLMVSDFIKAYNAFLALSVEEASHAPHLQCQAREILKCSANQEGYWNNLFMDQAEIATRIAEQKYAADRYYIVWLFDQSSGHCAYEDDALNVQNMSISPGGIQP